MSEELESMHDIQEFLDNMAEHSSTIEEDGRAVIIDIIPQDTQRFFWRVLVSHNDVITVSTGFSKTKVDAIAAVEARLHESRPCEPFFVEWTKEFTRPGEVLFIDQVM